MPIFSGSQKGSETGAGIKVGQAEPINRSVLCHQRSGVTITDQGVVFNGFGQTTLPRMLG